MDRLLDYSRIAAFLLDTIRKQADAGATGWLTTQATTIAADEKGGKLSLAFGQASRYFPKDRLVLEQGEVSESERLRKDWKPEHWNLLQTARTYLVLHLPAEDPEQWLKRLNRLFETGDMYEQEALYAALCVLPHQPLLAKRASEGLRSNITTIFDAVALNNPFPAEQLNETAWNQLVMKAIFLQRPLYQILGSDGRNNASLADTLLDAVRERWSANRSVMPELWRYVSPYIDDTNVYLIKRLFDQGNDLEIQAAMLACKNISLPEVRELAEKHPHIGTRIDKGEITWKSIGQEYVPFS